ncbi:hypothetical protein CK203_065753 [Vitis vinifera]|uniref:Uncharacterized protein n=1 Tax=Vitis vinifera TaxID=29760 RepID=A0A438G3D4_VITVI|nr:hypothetical protein CK203_065753 [Vitis vinifera]
MNFMSYVAEVSRGWDEPNARVMGRMTSQPNAKGEMYILNDGIDMKAKIAAMARRLEELEMKKMQEPPQYKQPIQALLQASNLEQAMETFPSQPHQNSKGIHEVEAQKGESSMVKEVEAVITLRSGKEVDLPTSKLEHDEESETEKEKREEIKGKKKGKSTEKDDYDVNVDEEPQRIVIKEKMMKKHMPPLFPQALNGKIIQSKCQVRDANFIWDPGKLNQDQIF